MSIDNIGYAHRSATSAAAATSMAPSVKGMRDRVLSTLQAFPDGLTADEIATLMDMPVLAVRPRVTELVNDNKVFPHREGIRRPNISGRTASVWVS
jgi:predicted ArsR family transcriptional regulator